jgi:gamma-glutamyltranspeptidase / glutathione hydrolase
MTKKVVTKITLLVLVVFVVANATAQVYRSHARRATNHRLNPYNFTIKKQLQATDFAVVSAHALASNAGANMLRMGGNAIDAAIATQFALAVVYPNAGNLGGGGFLVARFKNGRTLGIDYREKAPSKAHRNMYLDSAGNPNLKLSQEGHLAAGVPGTVAGLFASLPYAKLPMATLIEPAIRLAENGFCISQNEADALNNLQADFLRLNTQSTALVKIGGFKAGDTLIQTQLAQTLKRIQAKGKNGFYLGQTAALIVAEMQRNNGIITLADLKNYTAKIRPVNSFNYKGHQVITMSLPSSGGIILQQMLGMIADKNIGQYPHGSAQHLQLMVEAERRAYADRAEFLGDPDFTKVPTKKLTSPAYLQQRMANYQPNIAGSSVITKAGVIPESEETTHISIVDAEGNCVSVTTTLNGSYGSKTVVGGAGFLLNNEMDDFSIKPGTPNMYGAVGNEKNAIAPGKRMLSSMTPTIVTKNNKPFMVVGTPGGTTITTSVFQSIVNVIDFNLPADEAVYKPKFHHQWLPDVIFVEKQINATSIKNLEAMGYKITPRGNIGRTELILFKNGKIHAVADTRGDDAVDGR